jgi:hypothetical protein
VHSQDNGCAVVKCQKPNNDGLLGGCAVAKGDSGEKTRPRSDDLPYTGPVVEVPDLGPDPLDEHNAPGAAQDQGTVAAVKLMITRADKARLRERGFTDQDIAHMTPQDAQAVLQQPAPRFAHEDAGEPCLSAWDIHKLAPSYCDRVHALMHERGTTDLDLSKLDADLRQKLADLGVPPERIEIEFERVMAEIFKTSSH